MSAEHFAFARRWCCFRRPYQTIYQSVHPLYRARTGYLTNAIWVRDLIVGLRVLEVPTDTGGTAIPRGSTQFLNGQVVRDTLTLKLMSRGLTEYQPSISAAGICYAGDVV